MITSAWNTGRQYTAQGQRIAACYKPIANDGDWLSTKGIVTFADVDRCIYGTFEVIDDITTTEQLKQATMRNYDNCAYTDALVSSVHSLRFVALNLG